MGNMSYCRFENTLGDLRDCYEHMDDEEYLSVDERKAFKRLVQLCSDISIDYGDGEPK